MVSRGTESLISPIIVLVERQREKVERLVDYCYRLDGTVVIVAMKKEDYPPVYPQNAFHSEQSRALHHAAEMMEGQPFIWLEPDAIPLKPGWTEALSQEYYRAKKKFMISSDFQRHDLVGGIGVYPPETSWLVPTDYERSSWDLWLVQSIPHLLHRTPLIQHSYCIYNAAGFCKDEHRFPRDSGMLRPEAVIFHRDPNQDLLSLTGISESVMG